MSTTAPISLSWNSKKKAIWFWRSNSVSFDANCQEQIWKHYSDFENDYIEECYWKSKEQAEINDIVISFNMNMQFCKDDHTKKNKVKREEIDLSQYFREERFCYTERRMKSFVYQKASSISESIFCAWWTENSAIVKNHRAVAELAAQGTDLKRFKYIC